MVLGATPGQVPDLLGAVGMLNSNLQVEARHVLSYHARYTAISPDSRHEHFKLLPPPIDR